MLKFVRDDRRGAAFGGILAAFDTGIGTGSIAVGWMAQQIGFRGAFAHRRRPQRLFDPVLPVGGAAMARLSRGVLRRTPDPLSAARE